MEVLKVSEKKVDEVVNLKDEVARLRKTLDYNFKTSHKATKDLKKELNEKEINLERSGFKLEDLEAKLDYQKGENERYLQEIKEKQNEIKETISQLKEKSDENKNLKIKLESFREQLKANETMLGDMEKSLMSERDSQEKLKESYSNLEYDFKAFKENEISKFKTDIEFRVNQINELEKKVSESERENIRLKESFSSYENDSTSKIEMLKELLEKEKLKTKDYNELAKSLQKNQQALDEVERKLEIERNSVKELEGTREKLEQANNEFNNQITRFEADISNKTNEIEETLEKYNLLKAEFDRFKQKTLSDHENFANDKNRQIDKLSEKLTKREGENASLVERFAVLERENDYLNDQIGELAEKNRSMEALNLEITEKLEKTQNALSDTENAIQRENDAEKELREKYNALEIAHHEIKSRIPGFEADLTENKKIIEEFQTRISLLEKENARLMEAEGKALALERDAHEELKGKYSELESRYEEFRETNLSKYENELKEKLNLIKHLETKIPLLEAENSKLSDMLQNVEKETGSKIEVLKELYGKEKGKNEVALDEITEKNNLIEELKNQINYREIDISGLKSEISSLQGEISAINEEKSQIFPEIERLNGLITEKDKEVIALKGNLKERDHKNLELVERIDEFNGLESSLVELQREIISLRLGKEEIIEQIEIHQNIIAEKVRKIDRLESYTDVLEKAQKNFDDDLEEKTAINSNQQNEISSLKNIISQLNFDKEKMMEQFKAVEDENNAINEENANLVNINGELKEDLKNNDERVEALEDEFELMVKENHKLHGKFVESQKKVSELEELEANYISFKSEKEEILQQMESQRNQMEELKSKLEDREMALSDSQNELSALQNGNSKLGSEKDKIIEELNNINIGKAKMEELNNNLIENLKVNLGKIIALEDELNLSDARNQKLHEKYDKSQEKLKEMEELDARKFSIESEKNEILQQIESSRNQIRKMTEKIEEQESQKDISGKKLEELKSELKGKENNISSLQNEISELKNHISVLDGEKNEIRSKFDARGNEESEALKEITKKIETREEEIRELKTNIDQKEKEISKVGKELSQVKSKFDEIISTNQDLTNKNREYSELLGIRKEKEEYFQDSINEKDIIIKRYEKETKEFDEAKKKKIEFMQRMNEILNDRKWDNIVFELDHFDRYLENNLLKSNPFQTKISNEALFVNKDADALTRILRTLKHNQSAITFLIGPSGSGKTENADFISKNLPSEYLHWHNQLYRQNSKELAISIMENLDRKFTKGIKDKDRQQVINTFSRLMSALSKNDKKLFCIFDQGEFFSKDAMEFIINSTNPEFDNSRAFSGLIMAVPRFERKLDNLMEIYDTVLKRSIVREYTRPFNLSQSVENIARKLAFGKGQDYKELLRNRDFQPFDLDSIKSLYEISQGHPSTLNDLGYISLEIASKISPDSPIEEGIINEAWSIYPNKKLHKAAIKWYKEKDLFKQ